MAVLLAAALAVGAHAQRQAAPTPASIYVVAFREATVVAPCPQASRAASPWPELIPDIAVNFVAGVPDQQVKTSLESEFRRQRRYTVAASADAADLVFVAQDEYSAMLAADLPGKPGKAGSRYVAGLGDEPPMGLGAVTGVVVPAAAWREHWTDPPALVAAALWQGVAFEAGGGSRAGGKGPSLAEVIVRRFQDDFRGIRVTGLAYINNSPPQAQGNSPNRNVEAWDDFDRQMNAWKDGRRPPDAQSAPIGVPLPDRASLCAVPQPPRATPIELSRLAPPRSEVGSPAREASHASNAEFRSAVVAVLVPAVALDDHGAYVGGLTPSEFRLREEGVEQRVAGLLAGTDPVTIALAIDTSLSMRERLGALRASASTFIDDLRADDPVMIAAFGSRALLACDVTRDRDEARRALRSLKTEVGRTRLYDSLLAVRDRLESVPGRKAIVLLTDGLDATSGWVDDAGVLAVVQSSNLPVFVVQFDTRGGPSHPVLPPGAKILMAPPGYPDESAPFGRATDFLRRLSDSSGGRFEAATTLDQAAAGFRRITEDLRSQYVLFYYPSDQARDGSFRRLTVETTRPGVKVKAREGYRAASTPGAAR